MDESDFEGTLVLEKLTSIGKLDEFYEAVDSDNLKRAAALMKAAKIDPDSITMVLKKMTDAAGDS